MDRPDRQRDVALHVTRAGHGLSDGSGPRRNDSVGEARRRAHGRYPKRLRIRYGLTSHLSIYVPKFKAADDGSVFCQASTNSSICAETTSLPGLEKAGLFRVQANRYGNESLERVLAIARPTA
jgi:hypothetical protein